MESISPVTLDRDETLVAELHRLGVRHLVQTKAIEPRPLPPADLLSGLIANNDARMQAALILLFLRQPAYSQSVHIALACLSDAQGMELKLYYQAAGYLQSELEPALRMCLPDWKPLPDLFSAELGLPPFPQPDVDAALRALGDLHRQCSGLNCNWSGSYRQNLPLFLNHLQHDHRFQEFKQTLP
jgi:hypothetical protein